MIGIVDYGMGNLGSVRNAFEHLGHAARIFDDPQEAAGFERILLPGVGSFAQAMRNLDERGWSPVLREVAASGKPMLGICLGMQLLFDRGEEHGDTAGLGLVPGKVIRMQPTPPNRLPHVGWNTLDHARRHPLHAGVKDHVDFYFVHSYHCVPDDEADVLARVDHGGRVVASVARANVAGMQFHPEKSQAVGLKLLENFAGWDGGDTVGSALPW
ncbi:MAG: imidazole glycerol phosphate synthase subunit HisH [Moraxellaceae bacterium]|nr:imidazole glycerol phosphate synthase subunit HisH [Moraxellaceae bacterium]